MCHVGREWDGPLEVNFTFFSLGFEHSTVEVIVLLFVLLLHLVILLSLLTNQMSKLRVLRLHRLHVLWLHMPLVSVVLLVDVQ